jgi:hypothetical protein
MKYTESLRWVQALRPVRCGRAVACTQYQGLKARTRVFVSGKGPKEESGFRRFRVLALACWRGR